MSEQKLSERMREVIDLYEEIGAIQDPIWVQFQDEVAVLEAKLDALKEANAKARAILEEELGDSDLIHTEDESVAFRAFVVLAAQQEEE